MTRIELPEALRRHAPGIYCVHTCGARVRVSAWTGGDADDVWEADLRSLRAVTPEPVDALAVQVVAIDQHGQAWMLDSVEMAFA